MVVVQSTFISRAFGALLESLRSSFVWIRCRFGLPQLRFIDWHLRRFRGRSPAFPVVPRQLTLHRARRGAGSEPGTSGLNKVGRARVSGDTAARAPPNREYRSLGRDHDGLGRLVVQRLVIGLVPQQPQDVDQPEDPEDGRDERRQDVDRPERPSGLREDPRQAVGRGSSQPGQPAGSDPSWSMPTWIFIHCLPKVRPRVVSR